MFSETKQHMGQLETIYSNAEKYEPYIVNNYEVLKRPLDSLHQFNNSFVQIEDGTDRLKTDQLQKLTVPSKVNAASLNSLQNQASHDLSIRVLSVPKVNPKFVRPHTSETMSRNNSKVTQISYRPYINTNKKAFEQAKIPHRTENVRKLGTTAQFDSCSNASSILIQPNAKQKTFSEKRKILDDSRQLFQE